MKNYKTMKMLNVMLLLIITITQLNNFAIGQENSKSSAKNDENAILRDALKQALNKLEYYKDLAKAADQLIEAQKVTINNAKDLIKSNENEREKMQIVIDKSELVIKAQESNLIEYRKQITTYNQLVTNLEKQLNNERKKTSFWKKLSVISLVTGIVVGLTVAK